MEGFKEFQGKDLDSAIGEACAYFNTTREQLEIEIVQDAKSGIFGIVGTRKAMVRARRAQLQEAVSSILAQTTRKEMPRPPLRRSTERVRPGGARVNRQLKSLPANPPTSSSPKTKLNRSTHRHGKITPSEQPIDLVEPDLKDQVKEPSLKPGKKESKPKVEPHLVPQAPKGRKAPTPPREEPKKNQPKLPEDSLAVDFDLEPDLDISEDFSEGLPVISSSELATPEFKQLLEETLKVLVEPIVGDHIKITLKILDARLYVHLDCGESSGLLIGREGQTLLSLQYLTSRILTHKLGKIVRLQLDAGEYRTRQKDKLVEMIVVLAKKVRNSGRAFSTKPLSSYHRRLVHLALQEYPDLQTRSVGSGILKRVVIMPKRQNKASKKN